MSQHAHATHKDQLNAEEVSLETALSDATHAKHEAHAKVHPDEHAAREVLAGPESRAEALAPTPANDHHVLPKRDEVKPPEAVVPKEPTLPTKPPISALHGAHAAVPAPAALPVTRPLDAMELKAAEVALAQYVGANTSAELNEGMLLSLSECNEKGAGFKISITGPRVVANREEVGTTVELLLRQMDALNPIMSRKETNIHITKPADATDTVELHVNGFSVEQYKQAVRALAAMIPAVSAESVLRDAKEHAQAEPLAAAANANIAGPAVHEGMVQAPALEASR